MILVDTSVWIAILRQELAVDKDDYEEFYTCGPIVQEVLQGFKDDPLTNQYARYFMDIPPAERAFALRAIPECRRNLSPRQTKRIDNPIWRGLPDRRDRVGQRRYRLAS